MARLVWDIGFWFGFVLGIGSWFTDVGLRPFDFPLQELEGPTAEPLNCLGV